MADLISPLHYAGPGMTNQDAPVTLKEVPDFGMLQFSAWADTLVEMGAEAARIAGCPTAPGPGQMTQGDNGILMRVEPLKWWLISQSVAQVPSPAVAVEIGASLDVLHSRCWVQVGGLQAATLLNNFLPLDLRPKSFQIGNVASTGFHHVGVTLWRDKDGFNLLIPRSSAQSLWELLSQSARQYYDQ